MNERIKEVRTRLGLNQKELGDRMNLSQAHVSGIENGSKNVTDRLLADYCREFNINEHWLRTGNGQMFIENDSTIIADLAGEYDLDPIDQKIIEHYVNLDGSDRNKIKEYVVSLAEQINSFEETAASNDGMDIDTEVEKYRQELEASKKAQRSSVSDNTKGETS